MLQEHRIYFGADNPQAIDLKKEKKKKKKKCCLIFNIRPNIYQVVFKHRQEDITVSLQEDES